MPEEEVGASITRTCEQQDSMNRTCVFHKISICS